MKVFPGHTYTQEQLEQHGILTDKGNGENFYYKTNGVHFDMIKDGELFSVYVMNFS